VHATLRWYRTEAGHSVDGVLRRAREIEVPALGARRGFRFYCAFASEQGGAVTLAVFEDRAAALAAMDAGASGGTDTVPASRGDTTAGEVHHHDQTPGQRSGERLFVVVREYRGVALPEEALPLVQEHLLPVVRSQPGFVALYAFGDASDPARHASVSLWRSRDAAMAAHQRVLEVLAAGPLRGVLPAPPKVAAGPTCVVATAPPIEDGAGEAGVRRAPRHDAAGAGADDDNRSRR
jgi:hypothetical protein